MVFQERKQQLSVILKIDEKRHEVSDIEKQMSRPDFWQNREETTTVTQKLSELTGTIKMFDSAQTEEELIELEKLSRFNGEYDASNAVLSIHAGAGGTEAQDWAQMLMRMYTRYCEKRSWKVDVLSISYGEEAGIKSVTLEITGNNAFGYLKNEAGVHRLVRISPFDADKARHTSFTLVELVPELDKVGDIEIPEKELRIDVFRASGHGGQSVNTTDSAVRITHIPTNIVVSVQNERSQLQNKAKAMKILLSKLHQINQEQKKKTESQLRGEHLSMSWGNQIRNYVLQPYQQVKDLRTGVMSSNPTDVLDGNIDVFMNS